MRVVSRNESGEGVSVKLLVFTRMKGGILQGNIFLLSMKWSERGGRESSAEAAGSTKRRPRWGIA